MPRLLAIDLGADSVKVSEFQTSGRRYTLVERHQHAVAQDGSVVPALLNRLTALDALLESNPGWAAATVAVAWPAELAAIHRVELPFNDPAKVEKTLPFTIEGEVPFDMDEMVLGWRVEKKGTRADVMAVMVRRQLLGQLLEQLNVLKLDPRAIHIDSDIQGAWGTSGLTTAVIDVGHSHTIVSVVRDQKVLRSRAINVGGWQITQAIQQTAECTYEQAKAVKHGELAPQALFDEEITDVGDRGGSGYGRLPPGLKGQVDGILGLLLAEVRSTLIAAEDELQLEVDEVKLTGGGSRITELWDFLGQDLGLQVSRVTDKDGDPIPPEFAVSHALALQMVGASGDAVDMRVGEFAYKGGTDAVRAALIYGISGTAFFAMAAVLIFAFQYTQLVRQQNRVERQLVNTVVETFPELPVSKDTNLAASIMREEALTAAERAEVLSASNGGIPPVVDALYRLTKAMPDHPTVVVDVDRLQVTDRMVSFSAETDGYTAAGAIEEALKATPDFAQAKKGNENKKGTVVTFPVEIPLDAVEETFDGEEG
jgi:general secretion pathway protein L